MSSFQLWGVTAISTPAASAVSGTVNAGDEAVIESAIAHNTAGATITVSWHLVAPAGVANSANRIYYVSIATNDTDLCDGLLGRVIPAGYAIHASATAAGVNTAATGRIRQP